MADLLIEIGTEELPAGSITELADALAEGVFHALGDAGLAHEKPRCYATPRRIAACWPAVGERQSYQLLERRGPALKTAWQNGRPTRALEGFLASAGASVEDLDTFSTSKGEWVVLKRRVPGKTLTELLSEILPDVLRNLPMPRRMRWSSLAHEFLRPVHWLLCLHGQTVLPISAFGLQADRLTYGHRFHAPAAISLAHSSHYVPELETAYVVPAFEERRQRVVEAVEAQAAALGFSPCMETELIDEVTALVEWPVALAGSFESRFLEVPEEALIQTMQDNQRYFALRDELGRLQPAFITVANIASRAPATVIAGNERVIRPRFEDTAFFWNQDITRRLEDRLPELDTLSFHKRLGSVGDKVARLQVLAGFLAQPLGADPDECILAARLCKCDLTTELVRELPKMQGIAARYLAERDGLPGHLAMALEAHYLPRHSGDVLPQEAVSLAVAIADRVDTLVGIFGIGEKPSGASDPYALRRAALGLVRILVERKLNIALDQLFMESAVTYGKTLVGLSEDELTGWVLDRLRSYAASEGYSPDVIEAVFAQGLTRPRDIALRLEAIRVFRDTPAAESLAAASKRIGNLLRKSNEHNNADVSPSLLMEPAEQLLHSELKSLKPVIEQHLALGEYTLAMSRTAELREPIDRFFDTVMVMTEDAALRQNRLALLAELDTLCSGTADLARLQPREPHQAL